MKKNEKNNKKIMIIGLAAIAIGAAGFLGYTTFQARTAKKTGEETITAFTKALKNQNYDQLSNYITIDAKTQKNYSKKAVNEKYQAVFTGIGANNVKISDIKIKGDDFSYELSFSTGLGSLKNNYSGTFSDQNKKINWKPDLIFPTMSGKDTVSYQNDPAVRGEILDRNDAAIAANGTVYRLGVTPVKLGSGSGKNTAIEEIATYTGLTTDEINTALDQGWVEDDSFVPLATVNSLPEDLPEELDYQEATGRNYPLGEAAAQLTGYVGKATAEDIEKNNALVSGSVIGRAGLELSYDKQLRGTDGGTLVINDKNGDQKKVLQKVNKKDGKNIKLTIDSQAQQVAYQSLGGQPGSSVAMAPKSGDLLVLASSPSFDPNLMTNGISQTDYDAYNNDANLPFSNRFSTGYAPGSTFKTITASIGLDAGTLNPSEEIAIDGLKWQEDSTWGGYQITRVSEVSPVDLETALVYSDNIYMAQQTLKMGSKTFLAGLDKFIFGEKLDLPISMNPAQISNDGTFSSDILLADTGYGQGQLLLNPIQQITTYSVLPNKGTLVYPKLLASKETKTKKAAIKESSATTVTTDMQAVVTDPNGTAYILNSLGLPIAAKTGTAEIKTEQDTKGQENSFLYAFDTSNQAYSVLNFLENAQDGDSAVGRSGDLLTYLSENYQ
ncbi:penicillin-binding protein PBP4(5) [Enterococcus sp. AZ103]|uniref:penicillin-binding protein PBP4(5) n=1 Tax=Enterococcus sp. AZ103 TaxID=2774628 RepID=UPI003F1F3D73